MGSEQIERATRESGIYGSVIAVGNWNLPPLGWPSVELISWPHVTGLIGPQACQLSSS